MERGRLVIAAAMAVAVCAGGAAWAANADAPTLVINRQVGDVRMGESEAAVGYEYGPDCLSGCPGPSDGGCVLGLKACAGPTYRYRVAGGYLRIGYIAHHVVYVETNSPRYVTATGLRVGAYIPFGAHFGPFHWHACGTSDGYWVAGTSWRQPLYEHGTARWWTQLAVNRGRVVEVSMWRGDVNYQGC